MTATRINDPGATGVKGNAETAYRTGNVNLSYPNLGVCPVANGGTGQTTLALARNAMGLGNTTGALPRANGGTGVTALSSAFAVTTHTVINNVTIAKLNYTDQSLSIAKAGWYPLGIVGWHGNTRYCPIIRCRLTARANGSGTIQMMASNVHASNSYACTATCDVLWVAV